MSLPETDLNKDHSHILDHDPHNNYDLENMENKSLLTDLHHELDDYNHLNPHHTDTSSSPLAPHDYFCKECRKIVTDRCDNDAHEDCLIPYDQLKQDFQKYKLFFEQNDPLYNIQKGFIKIKEALQHIAIPALQEDYSLKKKVFKENSNLYDFIDKIIYRNDKLLIDDLHLLPNLDELKRESYLIDIINTNYGMIKQQLLKPASYKFDYTMQNSKSYLNPYNQYYSSDNFMNSARKQTSFTEDDDQEENESLRKKTKQEEGAYTSHFQDNTNTQHKKASGYEIGLEHMTVKEREILRNMYNTKYEKHHHFTEVEKKMFAKFALLRKIKDGISVSETTEQWRLNRITVQIWLEKYKKMLNQKHDVEN